MRQGMKGGAEVEQRVNTWGQLYNVAVSVKERFRERVQVG